MFGMLIQGAQLDVWDSGRPPVNHLALRGHFTHLGWSPCRLTASPAPATFPPELEKTLREGTALWDETIWNRATQGSEPPSHTEVSE